jgi:hypothetical protein
VPVRRNEPASPGRIEWVIASPNSDIRRSSKKEPSRAQDTLAVIAVMIIHRSASLTVLLLLP